MSVKNTKSDITKILEEMIRCGEGMIAAVKALQKSFPATSEDQKPEEASTKVPAGPAEKETAAGEVKAEPVKTYSREDVRCVLSARSAEGFSKEVKAILGKYGADRLSALKPEHYEDVIREAEGIGNV